MGMRLAAGFWLWLALPLAAMAQPVDIPRTAEGYPDFHGVWESRWRTPFERPQEADGPIVPADKADALVAAMDARIEASGNLSPETDFDFHTLMPAPGGGFRTSQIVEPADGKRPLNEAAKAWGGVVRELRDKAEDPEVRSLTERCIKGPGGAPLQISPAGMFRRIMQTPQYVVIMTEDINDVRIIRMGERRQPDAIVSWTGDSIGRWNGDVLEIETSGLREDPSRLPAQPEEHRQKMRLTEQLRFNSPDELVYSYVTDDPATLTAPMRVEFILVRSKGPMFESSCHEGNHGLEGILRGARVLEQQTPAR